MNDAGDGIRLDSGLRQQGAGPLQDAERGIGGGEHLAGVRPFAVEIEQQQVGKGAANVDAEAPAALTIESSSLFSGSLGHDSGR